MERATPDIPRFTDRAHAGKMLAARLRHLKMREPLLLALPRGGVPVAYEVARELGLPLDVLVVRKLGVPSHPEYAMGAIVESGYYRINPRVTRAVGVSESEIEGVIEHEKDEIQRRLTRYRPDHNLPSLANRTVIVVDDGLATGATAQVACQYLRELGAGEVIVAAPVCSPRVEEKIRADSATLVCLSQPTDFSAVGYFYEDFSEVPDDTVVGLLEKSRLQ